MHEKQKESSTLPKSFKSPGITTTITMSTLKNTETK